MKIVSLSDPVTVFSIPERSLIGSLEYEARVRCNVSTHRHPGQRYAGYPSEWTDTVSWTTRPGIILLTVSQFFTVILIRNTLINISLCVYICLRTPRATSCCNFPVFSHRNPLSSHFCCRFFHSDCHAEVQL